MEVVDKSFISDKRKKKEANRRQVKEARKNRLKERANQKNIKESGGPMLSA